MRAIFFLFLIWRLIDFLVVFLSPYFISYLGFFPYSQILANYQLPEFISKLANFDGVHYLLIAQNGYQQYQQAFFPLYPLLIRWLTPLFLNNPLLAGFFISNLSFLIGLYFFSRYLLLLKINKKNLYLILIIILVFPTSFFFGAIYTEGLFFLLTGLSLYFLEKNQPGHYFLTAIFVFFASLTRLVGLFLILPIFFHFIKERQKKKNYPLSIIHYSLLVIPFLGLFFYGFYLWQTTADPLFFFHSQPAFGANRSTEIVLLPQVYWRYLKILFTARLNWQYFISLTELTIFTFVFVVLILDLLRTVKISLRKPINQRPFQINGQRRRLALKILNPSRLSLNLFSLANLFLPTLTGTFSSIPRYVLLSLSFFIFLSETKNKVFLAFLILIFFIFHILLLMFFSQGYFVA